MWGWLGFRETATASLVSRVLMHGVRNEIHNGTGRESRRARMSEFLACVCMLPSLCVCAVHSSSKFSGSARCPDRALC